MNYEFHRIIASSHHRIIASSHHRIIASSHHRGIAASQFALVGWRSCETPHDKELRIQDDVLTERTSARVLARSSTVNGFCSHAARFGLENPPLMGSGA